MMPVAMSPTAMENLPLGWPPMVTCAGPAAAGVLVDGAGDLVAGLDDVALD